MAKNSKASPERIQKPRGGGGGGLFDEFAKEEEGFYKSEFMSPCFDGRPIRVRIAGIVMKMRVVQPKKFTGWGIFRPRSPKECVLVREANMREREQYLGLFPSIRAILCARKDKQWMASPGRTGDNRFKITGLIPILLPVEAQMFDSIVARYDGQNFWYQGPDPSHDPKITQALRDRLVELGEPKNFRIPGMTIEEKEAYTVAYAHELENRKDRQEERIKEALRRGGAQYRSYVERGNSYTVEYVVDGQTHRSTVSKETLSVESAGICLTDHRTGRVGDRDFDLQSLVGVIREGMQTRQIHRW
jgi:hypothetical protein